MNKAARELEVRCCERADEEWKRQWWWFDEANRKHIHEFSTAWEILRRTKSFHALYEEMNRLNLECGAVAPNSLRNSTGFLEKFRRIVPKSSKFPTELREM